MLTHVDAGTGDGGVVVVARKPNPIKYCRQCGKKLERKTYNGRLEDLGMLKRRQFCNRECSSAAKRIANPKLSALRKRYVPLRGSVCQECGRADNLSVHHIDNNPANNAAENIITLCGSCHTKWHWRNGKKQKKRQSQCFWCDQPARKLDMCQLHYQRFKKYGNPLMTKCRIGSRYELVEQLPGPRIQRQSEARAKGVLACGKEKA